MKQALFLLYGSTRLFNELSVENQRKIWQGVQTGSRSLFESIAAQLRPAVNVHIHRLQQNGDGIKSIPVRLVRRDKPTIQRPVIPWLSSHDSVIPDTSASAQAGSESHNVTMKTLRDVLLYDFSPHIDMGSIDDAQCVVQGIAVPLNAPIFELWHLMSHCDLFLYITLLQ